MRRHFRLGARRIGDQRHRLAELTQVEQSLGGGGIAALAIMQHAPDIAKHGVIPVLRLGKSRQMFSGFGRAIFGIFIHFAGL